MRIGRPALAVGYARSHGVHDHERRAPRMDPIPGVDPWQDRQGHQRLLTMPVLAIVEKMVLWKRLLIPIYVLPVLWAVSVFLALNAFFLQKQNPDYAIVYTLALASSAAFLAAGIGMWTYSFINRRSQDRGFNRDIEVRYFEQIYGPLYEELSRVADDLKGNGWPTLVEWPRISKSRFGPVVDEAVSNLLSALSYRLTDYSHQSQKYFDAATRCIE